MKVLSLFDGMSAGQLALHRAGIEYDKYYASEIDKHCIKVTQNNFPDTIQLGDVENWRDWDIEWNEIDLIMAGSPCQGFSHAGKRKGFDDPRSKLFWHFVDIVDHCPNAYFLLENVIMKNEFLEVISDALKAEPVFINSKLVSAQDRKRYYWANFPIGQPEDKGILWKDGFIASKRGRYLIDGKRQDGKMKTAGLTKQYVEFRYDNKSNALTTVQKDNVVVPYTLPCRILASDIEWRYLTPEECEFLQTVPQGYTSSVSKTQRYKMLGNGWTADVISHILKELK